MGGCPHGGGAGSPAGSSFQRHQISNAASSAAMRACSAPGAPTAVAASARIKASAPVKDSR
eukprot:scaffold76753_cov30-Tisochrysis_lutea.AAC.3